jgi:capsular polysaccharide biosynthesis protein
MIRTGPPRGTQRRALGKLLELRDEPRTSPRVLALLVAAIVTVSVSAALAISLAMPTVFGAQADLLVRPGGDASGFGAERDLATQQAILQGSAVLGPVADAAGMPRERLEEMVSVENPAQTNILRLTVASRDRGTAQRLAEMTTDEYLRRASTAGDGAADPVAAQLERQADSLSRTLSQTLDRLAALSRQRRPGAATASEEQRLRAAATSALQRLGAVQDQLTALTTRRLGQADVSVVVPARLLERPLRPRPVQALAMGALLGLLVAASVVLALRRPRFRPEVDYWNDGWR